MANPFTHPAGQCLVDTLTSSSNDSILRNSTAFPHKSGIGTNISSLHDFTTRFVMFGEMPLPHHMANPFTHPAGQCLVDTLTSSSNDSILRNSTAFPHKSGIGTNISSLHDFTIWFVMFGEMPLPHHMANPFTHPAGQC